MQADRVSAGTKQTDGRSRADVADSISLTFPADDRFRSVSTLVVGGVGTRLELPYERMDDLQLALLSLLDAIAGDEATIELVAEDDAVELSVGPLRPGTSEDPGFERVISRLVDSRSSEARDGAEWITVRLLRGAVRPGS